MLMHLTTVIIKLLLLLFSGLGGGGEGGGEGAHWHWQCHKINVYQPKVKKKTKRSQDVVLPSHFDPLLVPVDK